jgi:hypothetical protein
MFLGQVNVELPIPSDINYSNEINNLLKNTLLVSGTCMLFITTTMDMMVDKVQRADMERRGEFSLMLSRMRARK